MTVPFFQRLSGIVGNFFQLGGPSGPGLNSNVAALEVKDPTNTTFAVMRGADPVAAHDFVNLESFHAGGGLPVNSQSLYVNKAGSDVTGNGSITAPFLTIAHAITVVNGFGDASTSKQYYINVGPGTWTDAILLPAWTWIVGGGELETLLAWSVALDPATWGPASFPVGGFMNLYMNTTGISLYTFDFHALGSKTGQVFFRNCIIEWTVAFQSYFGVGALNFNAFDFTNCKLNGTPEAFTQTGMHGTLNNTIIGGGSIVLNSQNDGSHEQTSLIALGGGMDSSVDPGGFGATWTAPGGAGPNDIFVFLSGFSVTGGLTLSGAQIVYEATSEGIPSAVVLLGAATAAPLLLTAPNLTGAELVYQPFGTAGGNIFTDFTLLEATGKSIKGPVRLRCDDTHTLAAPVVIPAGTHAWIYEILGMPNTVGQAPHASTVGPHNWVRLASGCLLPNWWRIDEKVYVEGSLLVAARTLPNNGRFEVCGGSCLTALSAHPIINTPGTGILATIYIGGLGIDSMDWPSVIGLGATGHGEIQINATDVIDMTSDYGHCSSGSVVGAGELDRFFLNLSALNAISYWSFYGATEVQAGVTTSFIYNFFEDVNQALTFAADAYTVSPSYAPYGWRPTAKPLYTDPLYPSPYIARAITELDVFVGGTGNAGDAAKSVTITLQNNGSPTTLTTTIADAQVGGTATVTGLEWFDNGQPSIEVTTSAPLVGTTSVAASIF